MISESDINAAVDSATAAPPPPADPASATAVPASPSAPAGPSLTPAPAPPTGLVGRSTRDVKPGERATVQPTPPSAASTTAPPYAVPPREEWESILENARTKAADSARREVQEQYTGLTPDLWDSHIRSYVEGLTTNPVAFHRWLGEQLASRGLNVAEPPPAPEPLSMPQPSLYADAGNGQSIPAYSAEDVQHALRVAHAHWSQELDQRLKPMESVVHEANVSRLMADADHHAAQIISEAKTLPYFDDLAPDIAQIMNSDKRYSVEGAYARALKEKMPSFKAQQRQAVLAELDKAPATKTAIDPSRPVIAGTRRTRGLSLEEKFDEALSSLTTR
jgi:hypothetical protein